MISQDEVAEWLNENFEDSIIRVFSDGCIEFAMNDPNIDGQMNLGSSDLPGLWRITDVTFASGGISFNIERRGIPNDTEELAVWLHEQYEDIAASVGWETQDGTSVDFSELPEDNREVMLELASRICEAQQERRPNATIVEPRDNHETPR